MTMRLLDRDPTTGIEDWFEDLGKDGFAVHTRHDVTANLEANKYVRDMGKEHWKAGGDFRLEASIPIGVQYLWKQRFGIEAWNPEHQADVVKKLNDPEWKYLKCAEIII